MNEKISDLKRELQLARAHRDKKLELSTLMKIGGEYSKQKQYKVALNYHQQCQKKASLYRLKLWEYGAFYNIGFVYEKWGDYENALEFYQKSMKIARTFDNRNLYMQLLIKVANLQKNQQQYQKALEFYQQALIIIQKMRNQRKEGQILHNIGLMFYFLGNFQEALEFNLQSLAIARKEGDKQFVRSDLLHIGNIYTLWGQGQEALEYYRQSLAMAQKDGDLDWKRIIKGNIGELYAKHGREQEALELFQKCLVMDQKTQDRKGESTSLSRIGNMYKAMGKHQEALEHFLQSLAIAQNDGDRLGEQLAHLNIGIIYRTWGRYGEALKCYHRSLAIAKDLSDPVGESNARFSLGMLYKDQSNFFEAIPYFQKAIKIQDFLSVSSRSSEIRISARIPLIKSLANLIPCLIATNQLTLALAYMEYSKGREMILEGLNKKKELNPELAKLTDQLTNAGEKLQETTEKHTNFKEFVKNIPKSIPSKEVFDILKQVKTPVKELIEASERKLKPEIKIILPRKKGAKIRIERKYPQRGMTIPERFDTLKKEGEQLRIERRNLQQGIWQKYPTEGTTLPDKPEKLVIDFQKKMPPNWIILDYYYDRIEHEYIIFVIQKNQEIKLFRRNVAQNEQQQLDQTILKIQKNIGSIDRDEAEEELKRVAKKIFEILIPEKLAEYLQQTTFQYMTIIPIGKMHSYPLELLHDGDNYWGLKYSMTRAFNLQILQPALDARKKKKKKIALLVGNPNENMMIPKSEILGKGNKGMINASLKLISKELVELDGLLKRDGYKTLILSEENATESALLETLNKNPYTLIHFAGHALFNSKNPEYSYLLLREANKLSKVYANELPVKTVLTGNPLVNLIACETGRIESKLGDEVFGLVRGFIEAGALGITISGWIVYEFYACLFFKNFYAHYITERLPIAESLRLARQDIQHMIHTRDEGRRYRGADLELLHWGAYRYYGLPF